MPRPKKAGAPEPKKRSRTGCWPCKARKVKCDEARPSCQNCQRQGEACDYSIRLNWEGRGRKSGANGEIMSGSSQIDFSSSMMVLGPSQPNSASAPISWSTLQKPRSPLSSFAPPVQLVSSFQGGLSPTQNVEGQNGCDSRPSISETVPLSYHESDSITVGSQLPGNAPVTSALLENFYFPLHGRPETGYAQSYERHRPYPDTPLYFAPPATPPQIGSPTSTSPFFGNNRDVHNALGANNSQEQPSKRRRVQHSQDLGALYDPRMPPPAYASYLGEPQTTLQQAPPPSLVGTPLTPASAYSDDGIYGAKTSPHQGHEAAEVRKLSVISLLSGPPGMPPEGDDVLELKIASDMGDWPGQIHDMHLGYEEFGVDRGFKDLDIGKHDDANALAASSPVVMKGHLDFVLGGSPEIMATEFGFGMEINSTAFEPGGYYEKPVSILIPRTLGPLPDKLLHNPMNLLYFHHFINHTAGCLIPHNCSSNPFRNILPQMAVQDDNLLNLLLAYSASHRARLLRQSEPATRIALWVENIFPNLRRALDSPSEIISDANLATAIMLASLEIISPKAFGVAVPWQQHLDTARQMIAARGGPQRMQTVSRDDKVSSFLWSWFAYLDVLGSLSGGKANSASSSWILDYDIDADDDFQIDCILGFTSRCIRLLAKIAEIARLTDQDRIGPDFEIIEGWKPSEENVERAVKLEADLAESRLHPARPCTHMQSTDEAAFQWDSLEMTATNEAYHLAGLVHLHRRILGKSSTHPDVQNAVREIFGALYKVRRGSSAEACLLFPMFTAGCDIQNDKQRLDILERIKGVERFGMTQVHKARTLMERVWETGKPWETLVAGEFFG